MRGEIGGDAINQRAINVGLVVVERGGTAIIGVEVDANATTVNETLLPLMRADLAVDGEVYGSVMPAILPEMVADIGVETRLDPLIADVVSPPMMAPIAVDFVDQGLVYPAIPTAYHPAANDATLTVSEDRDSLVVARGNQEIIVPPDDYVGPNPRRSAR